FDFLTIGFVAGVFFVAGCVATVVLVAPRETGFFAIARLATPLRDVATLGEAAMPGGLAGFVFLARGVAATINCPCERRRRAAPERVVRRESASSGNRPSRPRGTTRDRLAWHSQSWRQCAGVAKPASVG